MTTSVACKKSYVTPPVGQYVSESFSQKGCDQGQVIGSEFNLMEMTDIEYTHLQHIIQSHMEAQDVVDEVRLSPPSSADHEIKTSCRVCPSLNASPACQPGASSSLSSLPTDARFVPVPSNQESEDSQKVKMLLYSDSSSLGASVPTPNIYSDVPSDPVVRMRYIINTMRNNHQRAPLHASRPNPPARVCLENRFTCDLCDLTKKEESQSAVLNTFLSLLHNSTDMPGIAMHSLPENWPKAEKTGVEECAHAYMGNPVGLLSEDSKHPEGIEFMSLGSQCIVYTDMMNEEQVISMENAAVPKTGVLTRKPNAQTLQAQDPTIMHDSGKWTSVCLMPGLKAGRRTRATLDILQRKERHNRKERDRRRRIRLCCDELNMLVPFCHSETDKATTLQWTMAYLKYIQEIYGDSLKQDFQNMFCEKMDRGVLIKPNCAFDATECPNSTSNE